jgi:hypothetical protein
MVVLIGCTHGGAITIFNREVHKFFPKPNQELLDLINQLPSGTKVGLEVLDEEAQEHLKADLKKRVKKLNELQYIRRPAVFHWDEQAKLYWAQLISACRDGGKKDLPLEDKATWEEYFNRLIGSFRIGEYVHSRVLFKLEGESDFHYDMKLCRCNEAIHNAAVSIQKVHVLDRDAKLLEGIARTKPEVVCVGRAHLDRWVNNPGLFRGATGLEITQYFSEIPFFNNYEMYSQWLEGNPPDPKLLAEFVATQRAVSLMEKNRLDPGKTPDFAGLYDPYEPSVGYFEIFVDRTKQGFSGTILDIRGIAEFDGIIEADRIRFTKKYLKKDSTKDIAVEPIDYDLESIRGGFFGFFCTNTSAAPVYLQSFEGQSPLRLARQYHEALQTHGEKIKPRMRKALTFRAKPGQEII